MNEAHIGLWIILGYHHNIINMHVKRFYSAKQPKTTTKGARDLDDCISPPGLLSVRLNITRGVNEVHLGVRRVLGYHHHVRCT